MDFNFTWSSRSNQKTLTNEKTHIINLSELSRLKYDAWLIHTGMNIFFI